MKVKSEVAVAATKRRGAIQKLDESKLRKMKKGDESFENEEDEEILSSSGSDVDSLDSDEDGHQNEVQEYGEDDENDDDDENDENDDDDDDEEVEEEEEKAEVISGWADSMSKILNSSKPKHKKVLILSRAKKDYEVKPVDQRKLKVVEKLEIDGVDLDEEATIEDPVPQDPTLCLKTQRKLELKQKRLEKQWENLSRKKPEDSDIQRERSLLKIATKGVVQLFNAVAFQQKTVKVKLRKVRSSEFKKDKVLSQTKEMFSSALKKSSKMGTDDDDIEIKEEEDDISVTTRTVKSGRVKSAKKPSWQALQDDFMLDAKMKDWDRSSDSDGD